MRPSELQRRRGQHVCIHGDPKSGKSTIVSELLMQGYRLTWISLDNGHEVIFKLPLSKEQLDEQLNIIVVPDTKDFPVAVKTCQDIVSGKKVRICYQHGQSNCSICTSKKLQFSEFNPAEFGPRDILVFDHLGQLANSTMNHIMRKMSDEDKPEWSDYRVQGTLMDRFLTNVQQAQYNIICISHSCEVVMEDGKKRLVPVIGTDNFSRNSGKYFDHIIHVEVKNLKHNFGSATTYASSVVTGSRKDVAIEKMKEPSMAAFFDGSMPLPEVYAGKADETVVAQIEASLPDVEAASVELETAAEVTELQKEAEKQVGELVAIAGMMNTTVGDAVLKPTVTQTPAVSAPQSLETKALLDRLKAIRR